MPFDNISVVVLFNMSDCELPYFLHYVIYDRLFGLEKVDWEKILDNYTPEYLNRSSSIRSKPNSEAAKLPLPPEKYVGRYDHPGLRDNFFFTEHFLDGFNRKGLKFITDDQGMVEKLEMALQRGVKDIVFERRPS
jgi:hypothetical protein